MFAKSSRRVPGQARFRDDAAGGVAWTQGRFAGARDPYLRARVPRERLATIWASPSEQGRFADALAAFTAAVSALPPYRHSSVGRLAAKAIAEAAAEAAEERVP